MGAVRSSDLTSWYERINVVRAKENIGLSSVEIPNVQGVANLASQMTDLKTLILSHKDNTYLSHAVYDDINGLTVSSKKPIQKQDYDVFEAAVESLESICGNNNTTVNITTTCQTTTDITTTCKTTANITYTCSNVSNTTTYDDCSTSSCDTRICSTNSKTQICKTTENRTTYQEWSETVSPGVGNATYGASRSTGSSSSLNTYSFSGDRTQNDCSRTYNSTSTANYTTSNSTYSTYSSGNSTNSTDSTYSNSTNNTSANYTTSNNTNTTTCKTTSDNTNTTNQTTSNTTNSTNQTVSNTTYGVVP